MFSIYHYTNYYNLSDIIENSVIMDMDYNRALAGLLFINKPIGSTCLTIRKNIPIYPHKADAYFSFPLLIYDRIMKIAMQEIQHKMLISINIDDMYNRLSSFSRAVIYAQNQAAMTYYTTTSIICYTIPGVNQSIFEKHLQHLHDLRHEVSYIFEPINTTDNLDDNILEKYINKISKSNPILFYLCITDILWSISFIKSLKNYTHNYKLFYINSLLCFLEPFVKRYFTTYISGINKIADNIPLSKDEYIILKMTFGNDVINYNEIGAFYQICNILPDEFFQQLKILINNVVKSYITVNKFKVM